MNWNGEVRLLSTGSMRIFLPFICRKSVEWPSQVNCTFAGLDSAFRSDFMLGSGFSGVVCALLFRRSIMIFQYEASGASMGVSIRFRNLPSLKLGDCCKRCLRIFFVSFSAVKACAAIKNALKKQEIRNI